MNFTCWFPKIFAFLYTNEISSVIYRKPEIVMFHTTKHQRMKQMHKTQIPQIYLFNTHSILYGYNRSIPNTDKTQQGVNTLGVFCITSTLWPSDVIRDLDTGSGNGLSPGAPSNYFNQCWPIIRYCGINLRVSPNEILGISIGRKLHFCIQISQGPKSYPDTSISHTLGIPTSGSTKSHRRISEQLSTGHMQLNWNVTLAALMSGFSLRLHVAGTPQKGRQVDPDLGPVWLINTDVLAAHISPWKRSERPLVWMATFRLLYVSRSEPRKRIRDSAE